MELGVSQRDIKEREKEISSNLERIRRLEADKDKLQEEVYIKKMSNCVYEIIECPLTHCFNIYCPNQ